MMINELFARKIFSIFSERLPFFLIGMSLLVNTVLAYDEDYYRLNPTLLQKAVTACPAIKPKDVTCEQLNEVARQMNELASELRIAPQAFGQKVLQLQEAIAKGTLALKAGKGSKALYAETEINKHLLYERLAVVKWLESPENK